MDDQELLFRGMQFCNKYKDSNHHCKLQCPLLNSMCITRNGNLNFKDESPEEYIYASINFTEFTRQFRKMIDVIEKEEL